MTDRSGRLRPAEHYFFSAADAIDEELVVLDFSSTRLEVLESHPDRQRRVRGFDPYNTVEHPLRRQPWSRVERR